MKKAFTMIEVIFVIVIIGILASVAMNKIAATRDDAEAEMCANEVGQLIHEITNEYTKVGNAIFITETASAMTNIKIISVSSEHQGIKADTRVDSVGIVYRCGAEDIVTLVGTNAGKEYNLTVTVTIGSNPVPKKASESILYHVIGGSSPKVFSL